MPIVLIKVESQEVHYSGVRVCRQAAEIRPVYVCLFLTGITITSRGNVAVVMKRERHPS